MHRFAHPAVPSNTIHLEPDELSFSVLWTVPSVFFSSAVRRFPKPLPAFLPAPRLLPDPLHLLPVPELSWFPDLSFELLPSPLPKQFPPSPLPQVLSAKAAIPYRKMLPLPVQFPDPDFSRFRGSSSGIGCSLPVFSWTDAAGSVFPPHRHGSDVSGCLLLFWLRRVLRPYTAGSDMHIRLPAGSVPDPARYEVHCDPDTADLPPDPPESVFRF